ncbi:DNA-directed RNA polymerase I subunit rpa49 [Euphorbia lathyris]|uniref:DNA-directed RNA polymerase I subunit rpa49 n=1 Tax=Euphorbia lathyris TaxID=212925 RepID=UPI003313A1D5
MKMGLESQASPETATKKSRKKRKREKENGDDGTVPVQNEQEPNEQQPVNVQIDVIYDHIEKTPPIVGYFPSGYKFQKNDTSANLEEQGHPAVRFYRNAQRSKVEKADKWKSSERMELVVTPTSSNVEFVGKSYKGEAVAAQLCTYALGVMDKKSQTLKIMPIAGNKIFRLEPKIRGLDTSDKEPAVVENEELSAQNKGNGMETLTVTYGTKKKQNQLKKQKLLQMDNNPESLGDLSKKIDNIVINKEALETANVHEVRNIPPHNSSATTPQEAYPLNRIIMEGEWGFLEDVHAILQVESGVATGAYPTFVHNRIHKLQDIQNEEEKQTTSCIFSFINHLIKFKDLHSFDGGSAAKNHRFPNILKQRFSQLFDSVSRRLTVEKIDLLISYVLVLTLYADDFKTDPTDIAKDLKISPVNLRMHFENLGCKLVRENKVLLATLPVPLKFPTLRRRRRR